MSASHGEGAQGVDFGALLKSQPPITKLISPATAPLEMLNGVRVNTEGHRLETVTPLGTVAVELYWKEGDEKVPGDFFPALESTVDPEADANPLATQVHPYTILPDGSLYAIVARAPRDAVDTAWSEDRKVAIGGASAMFGGISLAEFRRAYPGVNVDLPDGQYSVTAQERTRPTLAAAARVENGEPLTRIQEVRGSTVRYRETLAGFVPSTLHPDTAVAAVDSRTTIRDGGKEADRQRLEFKAHDGFQRTGPGAAENSGIVEVIIMQCEAVECTGFTFTPYKLPAPPGPLYGNDFFGTRGGPATFGGGMKGFGGLSGGETRYRPPETVKVSMTGIRGMRAIAAFRFAMAATGRASSAPTA